MPPPYLYNESSALAGELLIEKFDPDILYSTHYATILRVTQKNKSVMPRLITHNIYIFYKSTSNLFQSSKQLFTALIPQHFHNDQDVRTSQILKQQNAVLKGGIHYA